jgi:hypothetical protein
MELNASHDLSRVQIGRVFDSASELCYSRAAAKSNLELVTWNSKPCFQ